MKTHDRELAPDDVDGRKIGSRDCDLDLPEWLRFDPDFKAV
jgi:hypothetical protein